jgi:hypothetical protein
MFARALRRSRSRGASMVEAVVAVPFFLVIFLSFGFVADVYASKQRTVSLSRQRAWELAMKGCKGQVPDATAGDGPSLAGIDFGAMGDFPGVGDAIGGAKLATGSKESKVPSDANKQVGGLSTDVKTKTWVPCDEVPVNGDLSLMAHHAWQTLVGW